MECSGRERGRSGGEQQPVRRTAASAAIRMPAAQILHPDLHQPEHCTARQQKHRLNWPSGLCRGLRSSHNGWPGATAAKWRPPRARLLASRLRRRPSCTSLWPLLPCIRRPAGTGSVRARAGVPARAAFPRARREIESWAAEEANARLGVPNPNPSPPADLGVTAVTSGLCCPCCASRPFWPPYPGACKRPHSTLNSRCRRADRLLTRWRPL